MFKLAAIIGGVLLLAGVALAGTVTSLGSTGSPTLSMPPAAATTLGRDDRGRERDARGRAQEPRGDLRGPCDEGEHANDPRCAAGKRTITVQHDDRDHVRGHDAGDDHGDRSGRGGGGEPGHGGHGRDD